MISGVHLNQHPISESLNTASERFLMRRVDRSTFWHFRGWLLAVVLWIRSTRWWFVRSLCSGVLDWERLSLCCVVRSFFQTSHHAIRCLLVMPKTLGCSRPSEFVRWECRFPLWFPLALRRRSNDDCDSVAIQSTQHGRSHQSRYRTSTSSMAAPPSLICGKGCQLRNILTLKRCFGIDSKTVTHFAKLSLSQSQRLKEPTKMNTESRNLAAELKRSG